MFGGKCSEEALLTASAACVTSFIAIGERIYTLNMCLTEAAPLSDIFVFRHHSDFLTYLFTW